jgi:uncharacterized membrane protein YkoI
MVQRNAMILAAAVTAFVMVLAGGVAASALLAAAAPAPAGPATLPLVIAPTGPAQPAQAYTFTAEQARSAALQAAPGAKALGTPELVSFEGTTAYEVILDQGKVYVDASTGQVLYNGATAAQAPAQPGNGPVTADQAAEIARNYLGGGNVLGVQLAQDDGRRFYVVVFDNRTLVAVDAGSGQIIGVRTGAGERDHELEEHQLEQSRG